MDEIIKPPAPEPTPATAPAPGDYVPVVGRSLRDKETLRILEQEAADKAARDYQHIVWAYGVLWALFAGYGIFLWRRSARLRADMDALRRTLEQPPR
jgi:hypothetical protein